MILEVAVLHIIPGEKAAFEKAFKKASTIIATSRGYISHKILQCLEKEDQYLLLVNWETLKDHEEGFRNSAPYKEWKKLLHHFYEPFPQVEHYQEVKY